MPGHWEGDLVVGKQGKTAMGTLVERNTRYFVPIALPDGRDAGSVREAIISSIEGIPAHLRKSITWDQGSEMAPACRSDPGYRHTGLLRARALPMGTRHEREHQPTRPRILPERDRNHF